MPDLPPPQTFDYFSKAGVVAILLLAVWALLAGRLVVRWVYDDLLRRYDDLQKRYDELLKLTRGATDGATRSTAVAEQSTALSERLMAAALALEAGQRQLLRDLDDDAQRAGREDRRPPRRNRPAEEADR